MVIFFKLFFKVFAILFLLTNCTDKLAFKVATMNVYGMKKLVKQDAPYEIQQATIDGCSTALWSRGNQFYRGMLTYRQNPELMKNPVYKFTWSRAYNVCFQMHNMDTFAVFGSKVVSNSFSGMFDIRDAKNWVGLPIGGNSNYAPDFVFKESTAKGMPGSSDDNKVGNFFGFWGTCQFC